MSHFLAIVRLVAFVAGLILLFVAERYLGAESYHLGLRIGGLVLAALGILATFALAATASRAGRPREAKSLRVASLWQLGGLLSVGFYFVYVKVLGDAAAPDTFATKALLAAWLLSLCFSIFAGAGLEWALWESGYGVNAEPDRIARAGASWLSVGVLLAILAAVNYAGDKKNETMDWSYLKIRTPSQPTLKYLKTVTEPMTIALFYPQGNEVKTLVSDYFGVVAAAEPRIKVEYYDKDMNPAAAEKYRVSRNGQIVFDVNGKKSRIDTNITVAKARKTLKALDSEFQKAFLEVSADKKTLYFTRGHGEMSWVGEAGDSELRSLRLIETFLRQQQYSTRLFGLAEGSGERIPDDAAAVVIVGPTQPFMPEEAAALKAYVENGGNVYVFLDIERGGAATELKPVTATDDDPLVKFLGETGIRFHDVPLANEKDNYAATNSPSDRWFLFTNGFTSHESVVTLARHDERIALLVYRAGYLTVTPELGKWKAFETVRSMAETFPDINRNFKADADEKKDVYVLGAAAELKEKKAPPAAADDKAKKAAKVRNGRVVAFSDSTAISDALIRNPANAVFFIDSLKWLVGAADVMGEVASEEDVKIRHTRKEDAVWFYGTVIVVPFLVLAAGFFATRRKRGDSAERSMKGADGGGGGYAA